MILIKFELREDFKPRFQAACEAEGYSMERVTRDLCESWVADVEAAQMAAELALQDREPKAI